MGKKPEKCENCGTPLNGDFCHVCGQKAVEVRRPVIGLAQDIIVETLSIDSRLLRTVGGLFINPGLVAKNYIDGHRVRYTPPFRIFLFFSLVFFATVFFVIKQGDNGLIVTTDFDEDAIERIEEGADDIGVINHDEGDQENASTENVDHADSGDQTAVEVQDENPTNNTDDNSDEMTKWEDVNYNGPAWLEGTIKRVFEQIQEVEKDPRLFLANVRDNIPRVLFLLPIIYPFLLLIFYFYKKNVFVYDLLIISLYMHAALYFYLFFVIIFQASPLQRIPIVSFGDELIQMFGIFQSYRALATNFATKWWAVLIKGTLINILYWITATFLIITGMAISLLL